MQNTILHIGFPKTATTTLQAVLGAHPECHYLGKGLRDTMAPSDSLDVASAVFFADTRRFEALLPELRDRLAALAEQTSCLILSDEAFTFAEHMDITRLWGRQSVTDHDVIADRLARLCPGARVLMSVRAQPDFLQSYYMQMDKRQRTEGSFSEFVDCEIEALPHRSMLHVLRYDEVFDAYAQRFGAEHIKVSVYEDYKSDFGSYLDRIARFCAIDPEQALSLWGEQHLNPRRKPREKPAIRKLRKYTPRGLGQFIPEGPREKLRAAMSEEPPSIDFSQAQTEALTAYFAAPNRTLERAAGLDLSGMGYPLA